MVKLEKVKKEIDRLYKISITPNHPEREKAHKRINHLWDTCVHAFHHPKKKEEPWSVS